MNAGFSEFKKKYKKKFLQNSSRCNRALTDRVLCATALCDHTASVAGRTPINQLNSEDDRGLQALLSCMLLLHFTMEL